MQLSEIRKPHRGTEETQEQVKNYQKFHNQSNSHDLQMENTRNLPHHLWWPQVFPVQPVEELEFLAKWNPTFSDSIVPTLKHLEVSSQIRDEVWTDKPEEQPIITESDS